MLNLQQGCISTKVCSGCKYTLSMGSPVGTIDDRNRTCYVYGPCLCGPTTCPKCGTVTPEPIKLPPANSVSFITPAFLVNAQELSRTAKYSSIETFTHLVEEVGEIGTCLNVEITGRKTLSEPVINECVDVINCALELFFKRGGTIEEFHEIITRKQEKWKTNLLKSDVGERR